MFPNYELRIKTIEKLLNKYDIKNIDECIDICNSFNLDVYKIVKDIQPICFEDAPYAYIIGASIALKDMRIRGANKQLIFDIFILNIRTLRGEL